MEQQYKSTIDQNLNKRENGRVEIFFCSVIFPGLKLNKLKYEIRAFSSKVNMNLQLKSRTKRGEAVC
jgi:hypothetical protein